MGAREKYRHFLGLLLLLLPLLSVAGCSLGTAGYREGGISPGREAGELDLLLVGGGSPAAATLLVAADGQTALVDGGPLGAPLAVLLDLCQRWRACEPDHLILSPAAVEGSPGLLFLLAGRDRQPGTDDDLRPTGAKLELEPERPCTTLACHALRDLLGPDRAGREGDTLLLGPLHRLRLRLAARRLEILGEEGPARGAILWGPAPCSLPASAREWSFADLSRCPAGSLELEAGAPALAILGAGKGRCAGLERDRDRLAEGGARILLVGAAEGCFLGPSVGVGRHLVLRVGAAEALPLHLSADGGIRPLPRG